MLSKLIKYDLKSLFKLLGPVYLVGLLLALVNGFMMVPAQVNSLVFDNTITSVLLDVFETLSLFGVFSIMLIANLWCVIRVYNSVFAKEGYLTNTLPVSQHSIMASKIISSFIALVASGLVVLLLLGIFSYGYFDFMFTFDDVKFVVLELLDNLFAVPVGAVILFVVFVLVNILATILQVFFAMALGHLTRHPIVLGIIFYLVIQYVVIQPIATVATFNLIETISGFIAVSSNDVLWGIYYQSIGALVAISSAFSVVFYGGTAYILKRKLNLQ